MIIMKKTNKIYKIIAQTCNSRNCRNDYKNELNDLCNAVTTPHRVDFSTRKIECLFCGKITTFSKPEKKL